MHIFRNEQVHRHSVPGGHRRADRVAETRLIRRGARQTRDQRRRRFRRDTRQRGQSRPARGRDLALGFLQLLFQAFVQRRGLFRTEYEGRTLRENLGLRPVVNRYAGGR